MVKIYLKVIESYIKEVDFSLIKKYDRKYTLDENIIFIEKMFEFEDDKTQMNYMIQKLKEKYKNVERDSNNKE